MGRFGRGMVTKDNSLLCNTGNTENKDRGRGRVKNREKYCFLTLVNLSFSRAIHGVLGWEAV